MKEYRKTKSVCVGVKGTLEEILLILMEGEIGYGDEGNIWYASKSDKVTLKYKGKNIDIKDIQVFIEESTD